jgi:hypothetical protein
VHIGIGVFADDQRGAGVVHEHCAQAARDFRVAHALGDIFRDVDDRATTRLDR